MKLMMASSILSPPTRTELDVTIPESEMTATSVVPPPTFLDQVDLSRPGRDGRFAHGPLLDGSDAGGHADDDARPHQPATVVRAADEVAEHRLGNLEVRDDAVLDGADRADRAGSAADHLLGFAAHGENALGTVLGVGDGDH
jgi:hypothetical protein